jgi:hypothetical protein
MTRKSSHYGVAPKRTVASNPIVLGARATFWLFYGGVALAAATLLIAIYWLLTHA